MTPHDLIAAFDTLAEAPDGVERLRELVLDMAVRGKLVAQDPDDEPANRLVESIAAEKANLVEQKKISRPRALELVSSEDLPFDVPEGWRWARLAELVPGDLTDGDWVESKDQDPAGAVRLTQLADVGIDAFLDKSARFLTPETASRLNCTYLQAGDILIARLPRPLGRACVFPGLPQPAVTVVDVAIARCGDLVFNRYLVHLLNSPMVRTQVDALAAGTTRRRISTGNLRRLVVPCPPLAEQRRIVARVDELMGLLDRLDDARNAREGTRAALRDAALAALQDADTPEEVEVAWARIASHMHDLFTDPADVEPLRQTILQLAVRGRLVPQDPRDEPSKLLFEHIQEERAGLVPPKKLRKLRAGGPIQKDEAPFELPPGWLWVRLGDLLVDGPTNGWSPRSSDSETAIRTLKLSATTRGVFDGAHFKFVDASLPDDSPLWLRPGDLLVQRSNTPEYVGMAAVFDGEPNSFIYPDLMMRCRVASCVDVSYVHRALLAPFNRRWFAERASGTSQSMVKINQASLRATMLPLPPLNEQRRVVARTEDLMQLLVRLNDRLSCAAACLRAATAAAVHHLEF